MHVDSSDFGGTVECFMCTAELDVNESTAAPDESSVDYAQNGVNASPEFRSADSEPGESAAAPRAPSPFEDESEWSPSAFEENVDRRIAVPEPVEPEAPVAYHNPFGDDDDEDDASDESPYSPEAQKKPQTTAERLANVATPDRTKHVFIETNSALDVKTGEQCAECGRAIRGDWDRIKTAEGVICYVCSNQATHGIPDRVIDYKDKGKELTEADLLIDGSAKSEPVELTPWYRDPESDEFRRAVFILAVATVVFTFAVSLTDWGSLTDEQIGVARSDNRQLGEDVASMPGWAHGILTAWSLLSLFLSGLIATYVVLKANKWLPHHHFSLDVIQIGMIMIPLTIMHFALVAAQNLFAPIGMFGPIMAMLLPLARVMIASLILNMYLDAKIRHIIAIFFVYFILQNVVMAGIGVFILRGLTAIT